MADAVVGLRRSILEIAFWDGDLGVVSYQMDGNIT